MTAPIRSLSIKQLETPTARLKLAPRVKPYWHKISPGIALGYRAGPGSWNVRAADGKGGNWIKLIGHADDTETANGNSVLTYSQALDRARLLARGGDAGDANGARPVTVAEAIKDYRADLSTRRQNPANATQARCHLTPALLAKPVTLLTARELKAWRNGLVESGIRRSTLNRCLHALKAALNLAVRDSHGSITNMTAWTVGLARLSEDSVTTIDDNNILTDRQRADIISAAYGISEHLGVYVELHDALGHRSSQIRLIEGRDLRPGNAPVIMVKSSLKGKNRTERKTIPMPISADLAARLRAYAAGRKPNELLVRTPNGAGAWTKKDLHRPHVRRAVEAAGLDPDAVTLYAFRHTLITRTLERGLPIRVVAETFDTSDAMIQKTYSKFIVVEAQDALRAAMGISAGRGGNVVALRR